MLVRDVITVLENLAPPHLAEDWDNSGLQVGDPSSETKGCLLALDLTQEAVAETRNVGAALLVVHHPALFRPLSRISPQAPCGQAILSAIRVGVSVYAAHTSLDNSPEHGTPAALAAQLGLAAGPVLAPVAGLAEHAPRVVALTAEAEAISALLNQAGLSQSSSAAWRVHGPGEGVQRIRVELCLPGDAAGDLATRACRAGIEVCVTRGESTHGGGGTGMLVRVPQMSLSALAEYVSRKLPGASVRVGGRTERSVETVALVPGSGGSLVELAAARADALITGECSHHDGLRAQELGLGIVLAGHYETERPVLNLLAKRLRERLGEEFGVSISQARTDPFRDWEPGN